MELSDRPESEVTLWVSFCIGVSLCVIGAERCIRAVGVGEGVVFVVRGVRWLIIGRTKGTLRFAARGLAGSQADPEGKSNGLSEGFDAAMEFGLDTGEEGFVFDGFFDGGVVGFFDGGDAGG